jgi:hypothetical protein
MLGYRSVEALGTIVAALFAVWVPFSIYIAKLSMDHQDLVNQYGLGIPFDQAHPLDTRLQMLDTLSVVLLGVTVILFLFWFARAYGNLPTISPGTTKSRTSIATLMWILPFVSLLRPFGYLKEIWSRTERVAAGKPKPPVIIVVYWLTFLAGYLLNVAAISVDLRETATVEDAELGASLGVMSSISAVLCSFFIGLIVWTVTRRMTARCNEVTTAVLNAPQHA